jgi:PAS domain S-box-containing protein
MDWKSVSQLLVQRSDRPLLILDGSGRVRLLSPALEQMLGWRQHELEGRSWHDACASSEPVSSISAWLDPALNGSLLPYRCDATTRTGERVLLEVESMLLGASRAHGLLLFVNAVSPARTVGERPADEDLDYVVTTNPPEFGALRQVARVGTVAPRSVGGSEHCFRLLHKRNAPCEDCPLLQPAEKAWPRIVVRRRPGQAGRFEVVTSTPLDATTARVSVRFVADGALAGIREARIDDIADKAKLSNRERAVLGYLLTGDSPEAIAATLNISHRTARFHLTNLLRKLGADSRADLLRLAGF